MMVSVREAKARLSRLLDDAAAGNDIIITCDGRPKARLVGLSPLRIPFRVNWKLIRQHRRRGQPVRSAEQIVREDRDSRD